MKKQNGFTAVEVLLVLVLVAILGVTGWFVWHAKQNADKSLAAANNESAPAQTKQATTARKPEALAADWLRYQGDGFSFDYPKAYQTFKADAGQGTTDGVQAVLQSGVAGQAPFPGLSANSSLVLDKLAAVSTPISSRKYGPKIALKSGKWIVTEAQPADVKHYKVGDEYKEAAVDANKNAKVYTLQSADEGGVIYTLAFAAKDHLYTLQLPEFDSGTYSSNATKPNDQKPYDQLAAQIAASVFVQ